MILVVISTPHIPSSPQCTIVPFSYTNSNTSVKSAGNKVSHSQSSVLADEFLLFQEKTKNLSENDNTKFFRETNKENINGNVMFDIVETKRK